MNESDIGEYVTGERVGHNGLGEIPSASSDSDVVYDVQKALKEFEGDTDLLCRLIRIFLDSGPTIADERLKKHSNQTIMLLWRNMHTSSRDP